jgi:hypothetical protein
VPDLPPVPVAWPPVPALPAWPLLPPVAWPPDWLLLVLVPPDCPPALALLTPPAPPAPPELPPLPTVPPTLVLLCPPCDPPEEPPAGLTLQAETNSKAQVTADAFSEIGSRRFIMAPSGMCRAGTKPTSN